MNNEPTLAEINDDHSQPATKGDLAVLEQRIMDHFDVVAENIHHDVAGANADEISLIKDKQQEHEQRITAVERTR